MEVYEWIGIAAVTLMFITAAVWGVIIYLDWKDDDSGKFE